MTSLERRPEASDSSDNKLIARAKSGDVSAFTELYERHAVSVYRHILYRTGNRGDSEDLTQQTMVKAWRAIGRYQVTEVPFVVWLIAIAHNLVVSWLRRHREHEPLEADPLLVDPEPEPYEQAERRFTREAVRRAV
ncbi:MAG TPA: sigma-70 family RNA polymerase sigma factor, partial [Chloroflexota bacterium]|nr:sigma-70 family RNA polymerase sigma factor [Chloroflexota bacterium]